MSMSLSLSCFFRAIDFIYNEDMRANLVAVDFYQMQESIDILVTWLDESETELRFFLDKEETAKALEYVHQVENLFSILNRGYADRQIYDDERWEQEQAAKEA